MPIHPTALVSPEAVIDPTATIGPYVVIDGPVEIGAKTTIGPFCAISGETTIGERCEIHSRVTLGDIPQDLAFKEERSYCVIGDDVRIREGVTVHRATGEGNSTIIGDRCFLMTNSHVGHNCELEPGVILISGCLLGGHVYIGEKAIVSGNAAVHQFCRIGTLAMIGGLSKVTQDIPPFMMTDHNGNVTAINLVGLRRAGFGAAERKEIKEAFRILYRDGITHSNAMQILLEKDSSEVMEPLLNFLSETSNRGLTKRAA